jgi:hypothetical protein
MQRKKDDALMVAVMMSRGSVAGRCGGGSKAKLAKHKLLARNDIV